MTTAATEPTTSTALPTLTSGQVFHVGTLDAVDRQPWSLEGDGLSVSIHPDDWAHIARLPGAAWTLRRRDRRDLTFLDAHALTPDERAQITQWGIEQGWVDRRQIWAAQVVDEDGDPAGHFTFDTEDEARVEVEGEEDERPVWSFVGLVATDAFPAARVIRLDPVDVLLTVYVDRQRPDLDGVWWDDHYDPPQLSCPRGVLVRGLTGIVKRAQRP